MTKIEIIDETVEFYTHNPRSVNSGGCYYESPEGYHCAFSRCCTEDGIERLKDKEGTMVTSMPDYEEYLQDKYKGHSALFWRDLQTLHDDHSHWEESDLTIAGKAFVNDLKYKYVEDNP